MYEVKDLKDYPGLEGKFLKNHVNTYKELL